jgi:hypothetical protein
VLTIENLGRIVGVHDYQYEIINAGLSENGKLYIFRVHHLVDGGPSREIIVYLERKADANGWYKMAGSWLIRKNNHVSLTIESIAVIERLFNYIKMLC